VELSQGRCNVITASHASYKSSSVRIGLGSGLVLELGLGLGMGLCLLRSGLG